MTQFFTPEELELLEILEDPVKWITTTTGEIPRWYQIEMLKNPSKRKVLRLGRRCMVAGTPVLMSDGTWKPIEQIRVGEYVMSWDDEQLVERRVILEHDNGVKDTYRITISGLHVDCTSNHPLLIRDGPKYAWKSIEDGLKVGDLATLTDRHANIDSIEYLERQPTYDIGVDGTHNYIANGIVCHNTGKCIAEFANVNTEDGYIQAKDLYASNDKPRILTYDEDTRETYYTNGYFIWPNGIKPVYRITTAGGKVTHATDNHPFLVDNQWKDLEDIRAGDNILTLVAQDTVIGVDYVGDYETYDLTVPDTHTLVADDIISHNTWTMCAHMLWYAFTHEDAALIVATPYENQITLIFDQLRKFIAKAPELKDSVTIDRRNPQHIQFRNRSFIKGFTAGTKAGNAGGSLRGQRADFIYLDEMDYMTDADFDTIYAIALEAPARIGVWCASTPTGRRGMFWKLCCEKDLGWKEFHFPSTVNPEWDDSMESELRGMFSTEVAWEHEVEALFGDETIGVFKKEFIDRAKEDYKYLDRTIHKAYRCIGVDWDKYGAATQIVVVEFDSEERKFRVINRSEIPKSKFTLSNAVKRIVELNEAFNPDFIYVDRGYGEYQVETLHLYGEEHKETGLTNRVKGWHFNEHYEVRDPITKETRKTPLKPFMVNQLVYILEQNLLILNENDNTIWKQMENYQVIRKTINGQPVFSSENEHTVDALGLAILAFQLEFPHLADIMSETKIARNILQVQFITPDPLSMINNNSIFKGKTDPEWDEPGSPPPKRVPVGYNPKKDGSLYSWGPRGSTTRRSEPRRKMW